MSVAFTSSNTGKLHQLIFGGAIVGLALMVTKKMMSGGVSNFQTIAALLVAVALVLLLDKHYWILCPAFTTLGITIPGLPFDSSEVGCLSLVAMHFIRSATRRDPIAKFNRYALAAIPVFAWIVIIWILNPTGMAILGSESIGARFYFKIVLGFLTLMTLAKMKLGEKECKILFYTLLVSSIISAVMATARPNLLSEANEVTSERKTHYELIRMGFIFLLLYVRYGLSAILTSLPLFAITLTCAGGMILSGKRQIAACVALYPIFHAFVTKRDIMKTIVIGMIGVVMLVFVVAADDVFIELPHSVRRSLATVIPSYKEKYNLEGSSDTFRELVHNEAKSIIRNHPFVGRKGFAITLGDTVWIVDSYKGGTNIAAHVYSGNWHSMLYAFMADFGIPSLILWILFLAIALPHSIRIARHAPFSSFESTCSLYYTLLFLQVVAFSYTSGHSALNCFDLWMRFGFLLAIQNGLSVFRTEDNQPLQAPLRKALPPRNLPPSMRPSIPSH